MVAGHLNWTYGMPMYEYQCTECAREFEELVRSMDEKKIPACPHCDSRKVRRKMSVFAARQGTDRPSPMTGGGCGRCGDPQGPCAN